jgi:hypothetical protein
MTSNVRASDVISVDTGSTNQSINIQRNDRVLFVGKTGSGKTTTAATLLARLPWVVVLDPKHQFVWSMNVSKSASHSLPPNIILTDLKEAERIAEPYPIIYRPNKYECKTGCEAFWSWIFWRENTIVYVDEVMAVIRNAQALPDMYMQCVQMGRSRNIGVWSTSQRPTRIPQNLISESESFIMHELRNPRDLHRVAEFTDPRVERKPIRGHDFWYYGVREGVPRVVNAQNLYVGRKNGRIE